MHTTERTVSSLIENFLFSWRCKQFFFFSSWLIHPPDLPPPVKQGWHNQRQQRWSRTPPRVKGKKFRPLSKGRRAENLYLGFESICNSQAPGPLPVCWLRSTALTAPTSPKPWSQILTQQVCGRVWASVFLKNKKKSREDWRSLL